MAVSVWIHMDYVPWIIINEIVNFRVKYGHLLISYFHEESANIWRQYFVYLHVAVVMLYWLVFHNM